jgi:hypothetical protein
MQKGKRKEDVTACSSSGGQGDIICRVAAISAAREQAMFPAGNILYAVEKASCRYRRSSESIFEALIRIYPDQYDLVAAVVLGVR